MGKEHPFDGVNLRKEPEKYQIGRGEYGVFHAQPYKEELMRHWAFKTPEIAKISAEKIYSKFKDYHNQEDFVGMDLARKYLQMGYTRSRRYAKYKGGRKYEDDGSVKEVVELDEEKQKSALIFQSYLEKVKKNKLYLEKKKEFQNKKRSKS